MPDDAPSRRATTDDETVPRDRAEVAVEDTDEPTTRHDMVDMFLVAGAGLLLEISYTRIFSFKLFYYYTYLIIGLALLGIGAGSVAVALSPRLRRAPLGSVVGASTALGAALTAVGFVVVARTEVTVAEIWHYGTRASFTNLALLVVICLALFAPFATVGVVISTYFSRRTAEIGRLYFADLLGAGLACAAVVFLIATVGPPTAVMLAGLILAGVAVGRAWPTGEVRWRAVAAAVAVVLAVGVLAADTVEVVPEPTKGTPDPSEIEVSRWSPIFRVDADPNPDGGNIVLHHDGLIGSSIYGWDGDLASLEGRYDLDARSLPFTPLGREADEVVIVGAAGGNDILASLHFGAGHIDAIELNPVTHDLLTDTYAEFSGNVAHHPDVDYQLGDGRSFIERSDGGFDLVWYPAPDSYAASNAASSGAFVLSESFLYTVEAIDASLDGLSDDGIMATQFGELDYDGRPYRTARYISNVREALSRRGIDDPGAHVMVATSPTDVGANVYSTILVKATPFTDEEVARFEEQAAAMAAADGGTDVVVRHVPGMPADGTPVTEILALPDDQLDAFYDAYPYDLTPITDDQPYFWNFARPGTVLRDLGTPLEIHETFDPESGIGERVLLLLLGIATVLGLVFLIIPFLAIRRDWASLPLKGTSMVYFASLGVGFLFYEITLIQRLTLFLGYPTYSLTVTLASVLVFTGVGALASERVAHRGWSVGVWILGALAVLTAGYTFGLGPLIDALFGQTLAVRVVAAFLVVAPLGLCLGMFMPLGLRAVSRLTGLGREYVAWGWAVNGFASVVGSVLTTLLSMTFGFRAVMVLALAVYAVAVLALRRLVGGDPDDGHEGDAVTTGDAVPTPAR